MGSFLRKSGYISRIAKFVAAGGYDNEPRNSVMVSTRGTQKRDETKRKAWWGEFTFGENLTGKWELGPTTIWLSRSKSEWRVAYRSEYAPFSKKCAVTLPASQSGMQRFVNQHGKEVTVSRYIFKNSTNRVIVRPMMADRPVVIRPETPFYVFPKEEITLYIASPAWIRMEPDPLDKPLIEIPSLRPSDTWFGKSTVEGELCYALLTGARLEYEVLAEYAYRIITPVCVRNRADDILQLDRFQVPVQYLTIYESNEVLWTPTITIERERSGDLAALQIGKNIPSEAGAGRLLQPPREKAHTNLIFRAFGGLFH